MLDAPVDAWYVWIGLTVLGAGLLAVAADLPRSPHPDAVGPANAVDAVAGGDHARSGERRLAATSVRIEPHRIGLRSDGRTSFETYAYGPVTPVVEGSLLWEVLRGAHPEHVFDSPAAFETAAADARDREPTWQRADGALHVRNVTWEGIDVTLVGA